MLYLLFIEFKKYSFIINNNIEMFLLHVLASNKKNNFYVSFLFILNNKCCIFKLYNKFIKLEKKNISINLKQPTLSCFLKILLFTFDVEVNETLK
jgi:hypothetical protein